MDRGCVTLLCAEEQEQLYNGDCYIIQYSYAEDGKDYQLFLAWFGQDSVQVYSLLVLSKSRHSFIFSLAKEHFHQSEIKAIINIAIMVYESRLMRVALG